MFLQSSSTTQLLEAGAQLDRLSERLEETEAEFQTAVDYILDDCFFAVGQGVNGVKTVQHPAIIWLREHFRTKFLDAMRNHGNTWLADRNRVTAVCRLLGRRAVYYAGDSHLIDRASAMKAVDDVRKYCTAIATRRHRRSGDASTDDHAMYAGLWCVP